MFPFRNCSSSFWWLFKTSSLIFAVACNETLRNGNVGQISQLNNEISSLRQQLEHLDTFRNELIRERVEHDKTKSNYEETIKGLKERIEFLQLTPAKRSKIEAKTIKLPEPEPEVFEPAIELVTTTKDGGSF